MGGSQAATDERPGERLEGRMSDYWWWECRKCGLMMHFPVSIPNEAITSVRPPPCFDCHTNNDVRLRSAV